MCVAQTPLTIKQIRRPREFEYFPNGVPAARRAEVHADVLRNRFGVVDLNQVPFNKAAQIYVYDVTIVEGVFSTDENFTRSFAVLGAARGMPFHAFPRHFAVSSIKPRLSVTC